MHLYAFKLARFESVSSLNRNLTSHVTKMASAYFSNKILTKLTPTNPAVLGGIVNENVVK